ncbi:MAG: hypothetical protein ACRD2L_03965, partial [Terriglobia bacterium]
MTTTRMATGCRQDLLNISGFSQYWTGGMLASAVVMVFALTGTSQAQGGRFCSETAKTLFDACGAEGKDDSLVKKAICINISDREQRDDCLDEVKDERKEHDTLCREQRDGRLDACKSLGEGRYDPDFSPALFDDPKNPTNPNPYFPLTVGNRWEYRSPIQTDTLDVVNETKLIAGVT